MSIRPPVARTTPTSRKDAGARLEALSKRVPLRPGGHLDSGVADKARDTSETQAETMVRLLALQTRLDTMGPL